MTFLLNVLLCVMSVMAVVFFVLSLPVLGMLALEAIDDLKRRFSKNKSEK